MNYDENPPWMYGKFWIGSWTMDFWTNGVNQQVCSEWNSLQPIPACFSMGTEIKKEIKEFYEKRIDQDEIKREKRNEKRAKIAKSEILTVEN